MVWNKIRHDLVDKLLSITRDVIVFGTLLIGIWLISTLEFALYPPDGLIFFQNTIFPIRAHLFLDAADAGNLGLFSVRTLYFLAKGAFAR